ncbi:AAA family ATPase [Croceivirga thetidis]|uniref:AAA family ATPase n=1 Tax=Croceivirga thetidis TaxID=2721623 RepID=A0ABX1GV78_9FLAO|nr:AAA family ATPase [Croceivirga thetidis]NKI32951.1 AAA family ATPase [Croceivirga thetidis]
MKTKLNRFKVYNFRSIEESDWIDISDNSCLVGTNEAGKTNLLIALWKLNPANDEPIVPLDDFPRHLYSKYKANNHSEDVFIEADFLLSEDIQTEIASELKCDKEQVAMAYVRRKYDGKYYISFPYSKVDSYPIEKLHKLIEDFEEKLFSSDAFTKEAVELQDGIKAFLNQEKEAFPKESFKKEETTNLKKSIEEYILQNFGKKKNLPEIFNRNLLNHLQKMIESFDGAPVKTTPEVRQKVLKEIPKFVYYSDYGNLDSEIYLPRVIEDFERDDLSESARAKARTLDVLFKFVKLSPKEIYELGNESKTIIKKLNHVNQVVSTEEQEISEEEIQEWADKKKERGILLRSAATQLTQNFKRWWLQGDYIFDFEADGRHFRINVSDSLRPEQIELEGRSRGLQWFFSFFLVFLVETKEGHSNTVLLLDEPGLSLHPIAQYDLAKFFRKLSEENQLIYTSHSPFLVDMENLANVKAVYIDSQTGRTIVSSNLRYNEADAEKSIFPIHAALGLTVSDTLLLGCLPILVEGPSDQIYLNLIKRHLIGNGDLKNSKEIVFIPTGGVRGMGPVTKLVSSRDESLPYVLLDSDNVGKDYQKQLKKGRYRDEKEKVLGVGDFLGDKNWEIEDLIPADSLVTIIDRLYRSDQYFEDVHKKDVPIVDQIEDWAKNNSIDLGDGWKVEIARIAQSRFDSIMKSIPQATYNKWTKLFQSLTKE